MGWGIHCGHSVPTVTTARGGECKVPGPQPDIHIVAAK